LVDEVVHVAVEAAVIVAAEEQPALVVEEDPAGEMDGADAGKPAAGIDLAGREIEDPEDGDEGAEPEAARLDIAEGAELVGDLVVLELGERSDMGGVGPWRDHRVGRLALAQLPEEDRRVEDHQRRQQEEDERHADEIADPRELPAERRRLLGAEPE